MSEPSYLLSIDNGTQSVRALLFDTQGNLLAKGKVELDPYFSSQPGWAEQDPEYYWASLGAVSYTHLDVYKRQGGGRWQRRAETLGREARTRAMDLSLIHI